jgi:hypothetical protein
MNAGAAGPAGIAPEGNWPLHPVSPFLYPAP